MHSFFTNYVFDASPIKFNSVIACISGILFFTAWWIMFWILAEFPQFDGTYVLPGLFGSVAFLMINIVPPEAIYGDTFDTYKSCCGSFCLKLILFFGFMTAFGALIGTTYILFDDYILNSLEKQKAPGVATFIHNFLIFASTVVYRFRKPYDMF